MEYLKGNLANTTSAYQMITCKTSKDKPKRKRQRNGKRQCPACVMTKSEYNMHSICMSYQQDTENYLVIHKLIFNLCCVLCRMTQTMR